MAKIDREKVIEGLEFTLVESGWNAANAFDEELMIKAVTDAISLLKEQEAVTYKLVKAGEKSYPFYDLVCTGCGNKTGMRMDWKYCPGCGMAVKWE